MDNALIWGMTLGVSWLITKVGLMSARGPQWMYRWFQPRSPYGDPRSIQRLERALKPRKIDHRWGVLATLPSVVFVALCISVIGWEDSPLSFGVGLSLGYIGASAVSIRLGVLGKYNERVLAYAAMEVARRLHPAVANECLIPLAAHQNGGVRLSVVPALRALGTPEALQALEQMGNSADMALASAAQQAKSDLFALSSGSVAAIPVSDMDALAGDHARLFQRMRKGKRTKEYERDNQHMESLMQQMDALVFSQLTLRRSYPDLFCKECYTRSEIMGYEGWTWVRCRRCHEATHLAPHVKQAIGVIGADEQWRLQDGQLRIHLWDEASRKARAAEVGALEIVGGHLIQYDWAVSALVSQLESQGYSGDGRLQVRLVNRPPLEANSLQLLKMVDPGLQESQGLSELPDQDAVSATQSPASPPPVAGELPF